jgi:hypothetical protein
MSGFILIIFRRPVVFLNTDPIQYCETRSGDMIRNDHEAHLVHEVSPWIAQRHLSTNEFQTNGCYR